MRSRTTGSPIARALAGRQRTQPNPVRCGPRQSISTGNMRGILRQERYGTGDREGSVVEELPGNVPQGGPVRIRDSFLSVFASSRFFAAFEVIWAFLGAAAL